MHKCKRFIITHNFRMLHFHFHTIDSCVSHVVIADHKKYMYMSLRCPQFGYRAHFTQLLHR